MKFPPSKQPPKTNLYTKHMVLISSTRVRYKVNVVNLWLGFQNPLSNRSLTSNIVYYNVLIILHTHNAGNNQTIFICLRTEQTCCLVDNTSGEVEILFKLKNERVFVGLKMKTDPFGSHGQYKTWKQTI